MRPLQAARVSAVRFFLGKESTEMHGGSQARYCAGCGERVGVYEPLWLARNLQ